MADKETIAQLKNMISSFTPTTPQSLSPEKKSPTLSLEDNNEEIEPYDFDELYKKGHAKIERLLVVRDRSSHEIRKRLTQDEYPDEVIEALLERCIATGLLDDMRFAETLIRSRLRTGKGIVGITYDLRSYGINEQLVPGYPERFLEDAPDQFETARSLLESHPPTAKNKRQAAYAKLMRKGFSSDIAQRASRAWYEAYQKDSLHNLFSSTIF